MIKLNKKSYINIILIVMFISTYLAFTKYYYKTFSYDAFLKGFIILINHILNYIIKFLKIFIKSCFTENNVKVILIIAAIIYVINKHKLIDLFKGISTFQFKDFKIETTKIEKMFTNTKAELQELKESNVEEENKEKIVTNENKLRIIQILIDEPYIVEILNKFLNSNLRSLRVPWRVFKDNTTIAAVGKIFDYEIGPESIRLKSIKDEIKDELAQVYSDLINQGVI